MKNESHMIGITNEELINLITIGESGDQINSPCMPIATLGFAMGLLHAKGIGDPVTMIQVADMINKCIEQLIEKSNLPTVETETDCGMGPEDLEK